MNQVELNLGTAVLAGMLLGVSSLVLLLFCGRVVKSNGIVDGLFKFDTVDYKWKLAYVLGLVLSPTLYSMFYPLPHFGMIYLPDKFRYCGYIIVTVSGLLVGMGIRYGSGYNQGYGIFRLSKRSFIALPIVLFVAGLTVFFVRHFP